MTDPGKRLSELTQSTQSHVRTDVRTDEELMVDEVIHARVVRALGDPDD